MKTTLDLPDELLIAAKKAAAEQRRPLKALVEEGLRTVLNQPQTKRSPRRVRLITVKGGLPPDLDLSNREKMQDWINRNK
jgi:hypothetical protein